MSTPPGKRSASRLSNIAIISALSLPVPIGFAASQLGLLPAGLGLSAQIEEIPAPRLLASEPKSFPSELREKGLDTAERKRLFIDTLLPIVLTENERLSDERERMLLLLDRLEDGRELAPDHAAWLRELADGHRVSGDPVTDEDARRKLKKRIDIIPVDLALAQAALESGWGRSSYSRKHRDPFGMQGYLPKNSKAPKFASLRDAVQMYLRTLNSHPAYKSLRTIRERLREKGRELDGARLAAGLTRYSELGKGYVTKVLEMLRSNDFDAHTARLASTLADSRGMEDEA